MTTKQPDRVLIVEDDRSIAELLRIVLERQGFIVTIEGTCDGATKALENTTPSLVLLDLMLPDGNGLDLLRWLRDDMGSALPVVVLTAFRQEEKALRAFELGAADFVSKPFRPREVIARIQHVLSALPTAS